jgi:8-oxo-dGTP pyrophosphatase MutT (NUDIX family)
MRQWQMDVDEVRRRLADLRDRRADVFPVDGLPPSLREAAVLLLLWEEFGEVWLAFIRRGSTLGAHPDEVALPGGVSEADEASHETAVREAVEEIGIDVRQLTTYGRLDDAWSAAGHRIVPVVAWHYGIPRFRPDGIEAVDIAPVVITELADPANHQVKIVPLGDIDYEDDVLNCSGLTIVGVTADIVLDLVHWLDGRDRRRLAPRFAGLQYVARSGRFA